MHWGNLPFILLCVYSQHTVKRHQVCRALTSLSFWLANTSLSRIGVHWDSKASAWKRYGVERGAIQDVVITDEVVGVEDEREPHK